MELKDLHNVTTHHSQNKKICLNKYNEYRKCAFAVPILNVHLGFPSSGGKSFSLRTVQTAFTTHPTE